MEFEKGLFIQFFTDWEPSIAPHWFDIRMDALLDDKGKPVPVLVRREPGFLGEATRSQKLAMVVRYDSREDWKEDYYLVGPLSPGSRGLRSATGTISFFFPVKTQAVRFKNPADKDRQMAGDIPVSLLFYRYDAVRGEWGARIELDLSGVPLAKRSTLFGMLVRRSIGFRDRENQLHLAPREVSFGGSSGEGDTFLTCVHIDGEVKWPDANHPPVSVEADIVTDFSEKTYPFELKNVPGP